MNTLKHAVLNLALWALLSGALIAQENLVPNPSFEEYEKCPSDYGKEKTLEALHWSNYHYTPDYFNRCATNAKVGVPDNFFGKQEPAHGAAYVGFTVYHESAPNELIGMKLLEPIQKGKKYKFSIKVSLAENYSRYASDNIGILFTNQPEKAHNCGIYHFKSDKVIRDSQSWTTIEGLFIADDTYEHMLIGNFFDRKQTTIEEVNSSVNFKASYYFIDEVFVGEMIEQSPAPVEMMAGDIQLERGREFILRNIFFDTNKSSLKPESYQELDRLVQLMTQRKEVGLLITGHTDAVGNDDDNLVLSEQRAEAVKQYLIAKGIDRARLNAAGKGESEPMATNNTEEGRALNRRVVFAVR
jgi:outer membrane protein OmpA-like peptidoglycan-associated protein